MFPRFHPGIWGTSGRPITLSPRAPTSVTDGVKSASTDICQATLINGLCCSPSAHLPVVPDTESLVPVGLPTVECSSSDVQLLIKFMHPNVASGPDGIFSRMRVDVQGLHLRRPCSTVTINLHFPQEWKVSETTPIFKEGDPALVSNYCLTLLLSLISKLMEILVHKTLINHVRQNGFLSSKQLGFSQEVPPKKQSWLPLESGMKLWRGMSVWLVCSSKF